MPDLTTYIQNLVNQGYNVEQIKGQLLQYGYPEETIDQAIYSISHKHEVTHTIHLTKTSLIAIIIIVELGQLV